ncbi:MAG: 5'-nucleotidase C-terminal domain-containing protein, partial [Clostridiales bacterium]|nr:5'-nucleotidase C-terminal domain-containing protein [Clostridiales bacterium]
SNDVPAAELFGLDNEMTKAVAEAYDELGDRLNEVVATAQVDLTISDPVAVDANGKPVRMIRRAETNLGDLCADAYRLQSGADIGICNGGGIRSSVFAGHITQGDILNVYPFGNYLCVIEVTGQQVLDALEWGASKVPDENGGFLQVSGLTYEIHSYIDSSCTAGDNGMFASVAGERRVKNVKVGGEPIDPQKKYTLAGHNYMLLNLGDGFTMFGGANVLQNCVKLDNQMLIDFLTGSLDGTIGEEYEEPTGQRRIVIVEEKP